MKRGSHISLPLVLLAVAVGFTSQAPAESTENWGLMLLEGWVIQPSAQPRTAGDVLSAPRHAPKGWRQTSVPTTVLNTLVQNKAYPDPYFGMNQRSIPSTQYSAVRAPRTSPCPPTVRLTSRSFSFPRIIKANPSASILVGSTSGRTSG